MKEVSVNNQMKLSQHFSLGELTKTKYVTEDGNIPSHVEIENLIRVCGWLEELRARYNRLYVWNVEGGMWNDFLLAGVRPQSKVDAGVRPQSKVCAGVRPQSKVAGDCTLAPDPKPAAEFAEEPIVINSGYRSPEVNRLAGGATNSNHLTGCAVDIRCAGKVQMIRYASILLDIADGTKREFDELLLEQHGSVCWLHFAVRPKENRSRISFLKA